MSSEGRGRLFIVSAPSGAGKTTIVRRMIEATPGVAISRSYTSRSMRAGETDGVDYNFVTAERFCELRAANAFLEWAEVFGDFYGTGAAETEARLAAGEDLVLVIDVQGARKVRATGVESVGDLPDAAVARTARRTAARAKARSRGRHPPPACRRRAWRSRPTRNTTTSSSTTRSSRAPSASRAIILAERCRRGQMALRRGDRRTFDDVPVAVRVRRSVRRCRSSFVTFVSS